MIKAGSPLGCNALTLPPTSARRQPLQIRMTFWHPTTLRPLLRLRSGGATPLELPTHKLMRPPKALTLLRMMAEGVPEEQSH